MSWEPPAENRMSDPPGHAFKNGKAEGSEPTGSAAIAFWARAWGGWAGWGSSVVALVPPRRGQATSSMPANKEPRLHGRPLGALFGVSVPCSLDAAREGSASRVSPGIGSGQESRRGEGRGLLGKELSGWRKAWPTGEGEGPVNKSDGPAQVAAGPGSGQGLGAGGCCPQEASRCLRIWKERGSGRFLTAPGVLGMAGPSPARCLQGRASLGRSLLSWLPSLCHCPADRHSCPQNFLGTPRGTAEPAL